MKIDRPDGRHRSDGTETMVFTGRDFPPTGGGGIARVARKEFHRLETAWSGGRVAPEARRQGAALPEGAGMGQIPSSDDLGRRLVLTSRRLTSLSGKRRFKTVGWPADGGYRMTEGSDRVPEAIKIAAEHHRAGRLRQAERIYKRILKGQPDNADALHLLGVLSHQAGKNDVAVELIGKAIQSNPTKAFFFTNLAIVLHMQGKLDEAIESYRRALEIEPDLADAHTNLGTALQGQGKLDEAAASYQRALEIEPNRVEARIGLSAMLRSRGRLEKARTALRRAVRQKPLYTTNCTNQKKCLARVLQLIGVQNSYFALTARGQPMVSTGHFDTTHLIDNSKFTVHKFLILNNNLSDYTKDLPAFDVILNSIADPDVEPGSLEEADKFITHQNMPFINNPRTVFSTSRDNIYRLLNDVESLIVPKTIRVELVENDNASVLSVLDRYNLKTPLLIRPLGSHTGRGMMKIDDRSDFASVKMSHAIQTFYITEFHDCRGEDGYFRKMRFIFVGGKIFPSSFLISKGWMAHARVRGELMKHHGWMQEEERAFLEDYSEYIGQQNCKTLEEIYNRIRLDFFGIDCALHPNGNLLFFEANACMGIYTYESHKDFPHRWKYTRKIIKAFEDMIVAKIGNV